MKNIYSFFFTMIIVISLSISCEKEPNIGPEPNKPDKEDKDTTTTTKSWIYYSEFGAKGDGKTDDIDAIAAAHEFANQHNMGVKADKGSKYFIGGKSQTVSIQTNTDFGDAEFIIDDTNVENRNNHVFSVNSKHKPLKIGNIVSLNKEQENIGMPLPGNCLAIVVNSTVKQYKRKGSNANDGQSQTDLFLVDKNGNVDKNTPIIWDFNQVTDYIFYLMDEETLTITGGKFTTIANNDRSEYNYYNRGITIKRSNVVVDGLEHCVSGEGSQGAPYNGFLNISECANVTIKNTTLTGRKWYYNSSNVSMGTYDININKAINVSFVNCNQTNDINNNTYWGIMGSNYCKNIVYDNCSLSRFDAHMGVNNATIRNSTLGWQGVSVIGRGEFIIENSTLQAINLREDYGSTWEGEFVVRNCTFVAPRGSSYSLINGNNDGQHDFGYTCYMPKRITLENITIDDSKLTGDKGPAIFANFNREKTDNTYVEHYPYLVTEEVVLSGITTSRGHSLRISDNNFMFKEITIIEQ